MPITLFPRRRERSQGQSLVEFVIVLPWLLIFMMFALDLGRAFFSWVTLNNTARVAANFAAVNPRAWQTGNQTQLDAYADLIDSDFTAQNCPLRDAAPAPTFPNGTALGGTARVSLTCDFTLITPVLGNFVAQLAGPIPIGASAVFPIRMGVVSGTTGGGGPTPVAAFDVSPSVSGVAPFSVTFTDRSSPAPTTWEWTFGDGTEYSGPTPPVHTYDTGGVYSVTLTVSNGLSATTAVRTITVTDPVGPSANFNYAMNPPSGIAPVWVTFTDTSTGDPTKWNWTFDSGATSEEQNPPPQLYAASKTYSVTLTIQDALGQSSSITRQIVVLPVVQNCTVPDFKNLDTSDSIQATWATAGFDTQVIFDPLRPPEYKIKSQSLEAKSSQPCSGTVITVLDRNK